MEDTAWLRRYGSLVQAGLAAADVVVAPTRWMLEAVRESFTIVGRTVVVANGRQVAKGAAQTRTLQAVTAGRLWDEAKGRSVLRELRPVMPLLIVGECAFEGAAAEMLGDPVMLGACSENELMRTFRQSAVYVCTSVYEPFGLAPLEAALCGCAVVARDIASLREVWGGGACYFSTAQELEGLLRQFSESPARLAEAQARSAKRAAIYTRERMVQGYLAVFAHALAEGARAHAA